MEISSTDNSYSGPYSSSALFGPEGVAIDSNGDIWVAAGQGLAEFTAAGVNLSGASGYSAGGGGTFSSVAIDANGNAWATGYASVVEVGQNGSTLSGAGYTGGGINRPLAIAIDGSSNVWIADSNSVVSELSNGGAAISPATGFNVSSGKSPGGIAVDGSGNVWISSGGGATMVEMVGTGAPVVTPLSAGVRNNSLGSRP